MRTFSSTRSNIGVDSAVQPKNTLTTAKHPLKIFLNNRINDCIDVLSEILNRLEESSSKTCTLLLVYRQP